MVRVFQSGASGQTVKMLNINKYIVLFGVG